MYLVAQCSLFTQKCLRTHYFQKTFFNEQPLFEMVDSGLRLYWLTHSSFQQKINLYEWLFKPVLALQFLCQLNGSHLKWKSHLRVILLQKWIATKPENKNYFPVLFPHFTYTIVVKVITSKEFWKLLTTNSNAREITPLLQFWKV